MAERVMTVRVNQAREERVRETVSAGAIVMSRGMEERLCMDCAICGCEDRW
ncbi:hypothetical protein LguiB_001308 [Lonicera macranthoides]